jgi:hypothetical protein
MKLHPNEYAYAFDDGGNYRRSALEDEKYFERQGLRTRVTNERACWLNRAAAERRAGRKEEARKFVNKAMMMAGARQRRAVAVADTARAGVMLYRGYEIEVMDDGMLRVCRGDLYWERPSVTAVKDVIDTFFPRAPRRWRY